MIPAAIGFFLVGFGLGCFTSYIRGWNDHVDHVEAEGHARTAAQAAKDRKGWGGRWPFVAVGVFMAAMVVIGIVTR